MKRHRESLQWSIATSCLLFLAAVQASAQMNLLPQGSFEKPSINTEWAEGFNIPDNEEFRVVSEDGKHWLRIENWDAGRQLDCVHAYVKVTPQIASLTVSVRMRAAGLKIGKEGWHTARVAMMFEGGSFGYPDVPELRADSDWVTKSVELKVPAGATRLNIQPAMFYCTGVFEIADLTVTPRIVAPTQLGDAELPAGIALGWEKTTVTGNAKRAQMSLDGIWRFIPAIATDTDRPKLGWAYIKVPGDWQIRPRRPSSFLALGGGPQWDLYDGARVNLAWYERQAPVPRDWRGRTICLRFNRVSTDAMVYVNGTPMDCTFRRGRDGFTSNITSEPLLTEHAAIYFGTNAYIWEEPKYRAYLHDLFREGMLYNSSENGLDEYANMHQIQQLFRTNTWRSWRTAGLPGGLRTWSWIQDTLKENNGPTLAWIAGPAGATTAKDHHFKPGQSIEKQIVLINDTRKPQRFTAICSATVDGASAGEETEQGSLAVSEIRFIPVQVTVPTQAAGATTAGQIRLTTVIGETTHHDSFAFRVYADAGKRGGEIAVVDPLGMTSKMLADLGYTTRQWNGAATSLVVVGRNGFQEDPTVATRLEPYVRAGGRALICAQDPQWMAGALGWRVCPHVSRRVFPLNHPITEGIDADDLRDWTGTSTLIEPFPQYVGDYLRGNEREQPYAGWHWGNVGGVTSAAIEKPHRGGWRPLLECEFDLAYTPLMELDCGAGRLIVCTLDLEDHVVADPAARRLADRIIDYALHAPLSPRAGKVRYLGGTGGAAWLDKIGVNYQRSDVLDADVALLLIGPDAKIDSAALRAYAEQGGRIFFLPRSQADGGLGVTLKPAAAGRFSGSLSVPEWPEARGLSASDLRWRSYLDTEPWLVRDGADIGADGLLGRLVIGNGAALRSRLPPRFSHGR